MRQSEALPTTLLLNQGLGRQGLCPTGAEKGGEVIPAIVRAWGSMTTFTATGFSAAGDGLRRMASLEEAYLCPQQREQAAEKIYKQ